MPDNSSATPAGLIAQANDQVIQHWFDGRPSLIDVQRAGDVIPELQPHVMLHAGPPLTWDIMCGPMQGAVCGAAVFEGWADDLAAAAGMAARGEFTFVPNHHHRAVGPMTGITTMNQAVLIVENTTFGNRAFCTINEGLGKVMRFGGNDAGVRRRLAWLRDEFGPLLGKALRAGEGIVLKDIIARGLSMGDEMHQRNVACSSLFLRQIAGRMAACDAAPEALSASLNFIAGNDQFFLNLAMATGKALTDPAKHIKNSAIVTAMARNGTEFGIQVSGTGNRWFTAPVEMPQGLYFTGFTEADANPDMGDSTIVETIGLGGFAMAAAPAVAGFVGAGSAADALNYTRDMTEITWASNPEWSIPALDYQGVPTGIDIRYVVETGILPIINTGIAHREPGIGQVGAGIVSPPMACFTQALKALADSVAA